MIKRVSAWEARRNFGKLMDEVAQTNQPVIVESHGDAKIAVVPVHIAENWQRNLDRLRELLDRAAANANLTEEEAMELAVAEVRAHRAERRAKIDAA